MPQPDTHAAANLAPLRTTRLQLDWRFTMYVRESVHIREGAFILVPFHQDATPDQVDRLRELIAAIEPTSEVVGVWRVIPSGLIVDHVPTDAHPRTLAGQLGSLVDSTNALEDGDGFRLDADTFAESYHVRRQHIADQLAGRVPMEPPPSTKKGKPKTARR